VVRDEEKRKGPVDPRGETRVVNRFFLGDLLSAFCLQASDRVELYDYLSNKAAAAGSTRIDWARLLHAALRARELYRGLIFALDESPLYVGPLAKLEVLRNARFPQLIAVEGATGRSTFELAAASCALAAEQQCDANRRALEKLAEALPCARTRESIRIAAKHLAVCEGELYDAARREWESAVTRRGLAKDPLSRLSRTSKRPLRPRVRPPRA
jgi:hypothetical protein